jgi:hypothetical protein
MAGSLAWIRLRTVSVAAVLAVVTSAPAFGAGCKPDEDTFKALVDGGAGATHDLIVTGKVQCPSTGWKVVLTKAAAQENDPHDLLLQLNETPPSGMAGQIVLDMDVQFRLAAGATIEKVTIRGGGSEFSTAVTPGE